MGNANRRPTQCTRIVQFMKDFGEIDTLIAMREVGVLRLASRISELKKNGYKINKRMVNGKNRYGEKVSWVSYSLAENQ